MKRQKEEAMMKYWIFTHTGDMAGETFKQLIKSGNWGFELRKPTRTKIQSLKAGDIVMFYIGGPNGGFLCGEAKLKTDVHKPSRQSIGGPREMNLDAMVDFDTVNLWDGKRVVAKDRAIRDKLSFIKNKDNWGMTFGQSLVSISENDYQGIKTLIS